MKPESAIIRADCPVFFDVDLLHPTGLHNKQCPGRVPKRPCRCGTPKWLLRTGEQVTVLSRTDHSAMVTATLSASKTSSSVWVEAQALAPVPRHGGRPDETQKRPEKDIEVLLAWVTKNSFPIYKRRRIVPQGGDIVLLRVDHSRRVYNWWRLLAHTWTGALLVDPHLTPAQALHTTWERQLQVPGEPRSKLLPVFPLPDGTESPGWT